MVTVIDNTSAVYEGSLFDITAQMLVESNQIINDMYMSVLLSEHAYLYENGVEITYVDEAGDDTAAGTSIKDTILNKLKAAKDAVAKFFGGLINGIQEKIADFIQTLQAKGISKGTFDAMKAAKSNETIDITNWVTKSKDVLDIIKTTEFAKDEGGDSTFFNAEATIKRFTDRIDNLKLSEEQPKVQASTVLDNVYDILYNSRECINAAKEARKNADKSLDEAKKRVQQAKADNMSDLLKVISSKINANAKIMASISKTYGSLISNNAKAVKPLIRAYKKEKFISDVKAVPGNVKAAPGRAASAVKGAIDGAKDKLGKKKDVKESVFMSMVNDGKYFAE